jgi:RNA polymerase sigma-70 factor (ECF subfamily)
LAQVAAGDEYSFAVLYHQLYSELKPIRWRCVESGIEPSEVMQLSFVKLWLNRERLSEIKNLKAWIITVAYREYLMAVRKKLNYEDRLGVIASEPDVANAPITPFQIVNYQELKRITKEIIQELSPQRRAIYELSRDENLKIEEIATRLSISPNTVKSALQTSLKLIREKLIEAGYGPFSLIIFLQFLNSR